MNKIENDTAPSTGTCGGILPKNEKEVANTMASFYALQVALQTMKERCHQLQQRLSVVEEENLRLRIDKSKLSTNLPESKGEIGALQEHIAQLTRQKAQLTHHIYMVATENKQLWTRLSRLTEANQSLGNHLTKISDTLNKHSLGESTKPNQSIQIMNSCEKEKEVVGNEQKDTSLEEISLKIINSIIREKMELEQQCDQMSALQVSVEDCDFTLGQDCPELRKVLDNLREQRDQLVKQQAGLRATLAVLTSALRNGVPCKTCQSNDKGQKTSLETTFNGHKAPPTNPYTKVCEPPVDPEDNLTVQGDEFYEEDRICPLCNQIFRRSTKFEDFHSHVLTHFSDEEAEFDSVINNYEMVN